MSGISGLISSDFMPLAYELVVLSSFSSCIDIFFVFLDRFLCKADLFRNLLYLLETMVDA